MKLNNIIFILEGTDNSWRLTFLAVIVTIIIVSATIVSVKNVLKERKSKKETFDPNNITEYDRKVLDNEEIILKKRDD